MPATGRAAVWLMCVAAPAAFAQTVGTLVPVADGFHDMVHDFKRDVIYITTAASVLRYHVGSGTFLAPWSLPGTYPTGVDISADADRLAFGDFNSFVSGLHIYDLVSGTPVPTTVTDTIPFGDEDAIWSVAFDSDGAIYFAAESRCCTGGAHPLRRYDQLGNFSRVGGTLVDNALLTASGDRRRIAIAGASFPGIALYDTLTHVFSSVGGVNDPYEVATNRDGSQVMAPSYTGAGVWNIGQPGVQTLGVYGGNQPVAGVYHPMENLAYFPWGTTREVRVYDTSVNPIVQVGAYDFGYVFGTPGNWAYGMGRAKTSADGSLLMVKMPDGVRIHRMYAELSAQDGSAFTNSYKPVAIPLPGSIGNGGALRYGIVRPAARGAVSIAGGIATYRWRPAAAGIDTFRYRVSYGFAWKEAEVTVRIAPPVAPDFSADGHTDIPWETPEGKFQAWCMTDENAPAAQRRIELVGAVDAGWKVTHLADVDGDGIADLLLRHADGSIRLRYPRGDCARFDPGPLLLGAGTGWRVLHTADLNDDGKADLVFEHDDGRIAAWIMNGSTVAQGATLLAAGSGWSVSHIADFDGDGKSDFLWRHPDGRAAIWLMDALTPKATAQILNAGSGWRVAHTADLDGDGKADLVWEHEDGRVAVWVMNGVAMASGQEILPAGTGWKVHRTSDFDGDRKADILWSHPDGRVAIWIMDGVSPTAMAQILNAGSGWTVRRVADIDFDGKADLVWQHQDGRAAVWLMEAASMKRGAEILGAGTGWQVSEIGR